MLSILLEYRISISINDYKIIHSENVQMTSNPQLRRLALHLWSFCLCLLSDENTQKYMVKFWNSMWTNSCDQNTVQGKKRYYYYHQEGGYSDGLFLIKSPVLSDCHLFLKPFISFVCMWIIKFVDKQNLELEDIVQIFKSCMDNCRQLISFIF